MRESLLPATLFLLRTFISLKNHVDDEDKQNCQNDSFEAPRGMTVINEFSLFDLRDPIAAEIGWKKWFDAAKESGIPALVRFAELKEKRIDGLIAHAVYPISTGKLEGFNNKIKVAKRLAYGYRDNHFFFSLVRFLSIPFPNFP